MIDKVDLHNYYNNYQAGGVKKPSTDNIAFPFDEKEPGVIYEPSGKTREDQAAKPKEHPNAKIQEPENGVRMELSGTAMQKQESQNSILDLVRNIAVKAVTFLKETILSIWNGTPEAEQEAHAEEQTGDPAADVAEMQGNAAAQEMAVTQESGTAQKVETAADAGNSAEIDQILKSRDMDRLNEYLTGGGLRKAARNTDLLTTYNRNGRIVAVNPSDKRKILLGDFHEIKL